MAPIVFDSVPSNVRNPGVLTEAKVVKSGSGRVLKPFKALLVGSKTASGSMSNLAEPALVVTSDQVGVLAGFGSLLHAMAQAFFASNRSTPCYIIAVDDTAGTASVWTATVTVTTAVAGTIFFYIAGRRLQIAVTAAQAQNSIATAINAAIAADPTLPVTATVATNVVTITSKNKGVVSSEIDVRGNFQAGETYPGGVSVAIAQTTVGATDPTYGASLWSAIGEVQYDVIAFGHNGTANLTAIDTELRSRWGSTRKVDGRGFVGYRGTFSAAQSAGQALNSEFFFDMPARNAVTWTPEVGANVAALAAFYHSADPAGPLNQRTLDWMQPPIPSERYIWSEQNLLLYAGMSTFNVGQDGKCVIGRLITTYQKNSANVADNGWLDSTTVFSASYARWWFDTQWSSKFPRIKITTDESSSAPGVMTLTAIRSELTALYQALIDGGIAENLAGFLAAMVVQQNASDPTRLDVVLPLFLVNPVHVLAIQFQIEL